ncbi:MAG: efflux RND transporter periplasmic adaptor subunit, partial [Patescibacteria group bacterium]|nr:efflux RND transporter periplasmic adaptor subunit [Patescibacteria group bacterium]
VQTQASAVTQAQSAVDAAQAALDFKKAKARPEDVAAAQAQLSSAQAVLQLAQNAYANGLVTAPIDGLITSVDVKIGETASPGKPILTMISNQKFQIESYLSESEVGQIKLTDPAQVTLDAYGSDSVFNASIVSIDPAGSMVNGLTAYKLTLQFEQEDDRIKAGMGANVIIDDAKKQNVLVVPSTAVFRQNDQAFVLTQNATGGATRTPIQTGGEGLDGRIEVVSGLSEGQLVAIFGRNN